MDDTTEWCNYNKVDILQNASGLTFSRDLGRVTTVISFSALPRPPVAPFTDMDLL